MNRFVGHNCANYQRIVMGVLASSRSESEKVMDVSSCGILDTVCISPIFADLMLRRWAFRAELDSPPSANPPQITWISPRGCWC